MDELILELKREGVLRSPYVEAAFRAIDRKNFVLPEYAGEAYGNYPLPIGEGQTISQPYTVAFMLDLLDPRPGEKILDVGSGSGWTTALLAHIVSQRGFAKRSDLTVPLGKVLAIERIRKLCEFGRKNVSKYDFIKNGAAKFFCGDAALGLSSEAPFDKIIASASSGNAIPESWRKQLKIGGKIAAPVENSVWLYINKSETEWEEKEYPGFVFVPLVKRMDKKQELADSGQKKRRLKPPFLPTALLLTILLIYGLYAVFIPLKIDAKKTKIEIPSGIGSRAIGDLLKINGIIRSKWAFVAYTALKGAGSSLKPGAYEFGNGVAIPELVEKLVRGGEDPNEIAITIPEGWDLRDIGNYFERAGLVPSKEKLWEITGKPAKQYPPSAIFPPKKTFADRRRILESKPQAAILEGYLYPDTYRFFRGATPESIVLKMLENFEKKFAPELTDETYRQKKTIFEIVIVASLVEKEVVDEEDRKIVAGILWKRLSGGIPLQVDATVNYATGKKETPSAKDLAIDSLYNTYRHSGLPPGPIANPGIDAIRAAIYPKPSQYLYYLSTPEGKTIFSRTLKEHNAAKARHLK